MEKIAEFVGGKLLEIGVGRGLDYYLSRKSEKVLLEAVESELEKLKSTRDRILATLSDAEERRYIEDSSVLRWLRDLMTIAFDIEDVYDEFQTDKILAKTPIPGKGKCSRVFDLRDFADRIQKIRREYERVAKERNDLRLRKSEGVRKFNPKNRRQEGSLQDDHQFHGSLSVSSPYRRLLREC